MEGTGKTTGPLPAGDAVTLQLIAAGIIQLCESLNKGIPIQYPYPLVLQRGMDRLCATLLMRGQTPPSGVVDLLRWAQEPLRIWNLELPPELIGDGDRLLRDELPTDVCDSWAVSAAGEEDLTEQRFMKGVFEVCRSRESPALYTTFRSALIVPEHRVLTKLAYTKLALDFAIDGLDEYVRSAYAPAPASAHVAGEYLCCARCGNVLQPDHNGKPCCENDRCMVLGMDIGRHIAAAEEPVWLIRSLRRFVADPGLAELELKRKLEKLGCTVQLWPNFDEYDLRAVGPGRQVYLVDVKDWANPFLLARQVKNIPTNSSQEQAYYVFPDERGRAWPDYEAAFNRYSNGQRGLMMKRFLKLVKGEVNDARQ